MARKKDQENQQEKVAEHAAPFESWVDFEGFWHAAKNSYSLHPSMKVAIQKHFETLGVIGQPTKYLEALKHFGIK